MATKTRPAVKALLNAAGPTGWDAADRVSRSTALRRAADPSVHNRGAAQFLTGGSGACWQNAGATETTRAKIVPRVFVIMGFLSRERVLVSKKRVDNTGEGGASPYMQSISPLKIHPAGFVIMPFCVVNANMGW